MSSCRAFLICARVGWGSMLLISPPADRDNTAVSVGARVLGARQLLEAAVLAAEEPTPPRWIIVFDALHAASMVALAAFSPRLRREATRSAAASLALVAWSVRCDRRS